MSERKTQYRIVPRANGLWAVQKNEQYGKGIWTLEVDSAGYTIQFLTQTQAERHIDKQIKELERKEKDELHLKTPPRIYP